MTTYEFGNPGAETLLLQPVDRRDLAGMEAERCAIAAEAGGDFCLIALQIEDWNRELSPWEAPAVFGKEGFGGGGAETLARILALCPEDGRRRFIGGYSLAGLFALWAASRTDRFAGVAAASPSVWFPGFTERLMEEGIRCPRVYLSLGDREERTRNPVMASVGDRIRELAAWLPSQNVDCTLQWNPGNHFRDPELRTAKAFAWLLRQEEGGRAL